MNATERYYQNKIKDLEKRVEDLERKLQERKREDREENRKEDLLGRALEILIEFEDYMRNYGHLYGKGLFSIHKKTENLMNSWREEIGLGNMVKKSSIEELVKDSELQELDWWQPGGLDKEAIKDFERGLKELEDKFGETVKERCERICKEYGFSLYESWVDSEIKVYRFEIKIICPQKVRKELKFRAKSRIEVWKEVEKFLEYTKKSQLNLRS